jgi:hypothetical protein
MSSSYLHHGMVLKMLDRCPLRIAPAEKAIEILG